MVRKIAATITIVVLISLLVGPLVNFSGTAAPAAVEREQAGLGSSAASVAQAPQSAVAGSRPVDNAPSTPRTTDIQVGAKSAAVKPIDQPNPKDKARMMARQQALESGQTAEAAALAQTGTDRVLVILVEFAGTDVFTWTAPITPTDYTTGSQWDPLGISDPNEVVTDAAGNPVLGDCSNIITQTKKFTYTGPLHNQIEKPRSAADRSGQSIWSPDFNKQWFTDFMFGNGVVISYTRQDASPVYESFMGQSVNQYFGDLSNHTYTVTGDVIGWVSVPHSTWYYDADQCPGARSGASPSRGVIPGAGNARTLVTDALKQVNAISNTIPNFNWANYDTNGDGIIDRLWIVHAGYGEEDGTDLLNRAPVVQGTGTTPDPASFYGEAAVWSHSSSVTPPYSVTKNIAAGAYIVMPENGGIGVFAHEYAHNLGADDLYAYGEGETSAGFWALQADDWTGYPIGFEPPAPDPWHLDNWGWLQPAVITDTSKVYTVTLGQASYFNTNTYTGTAPIYRGAKIPLGTGYAPLAVKPLGKYNWWGGKADVANGKMTTKDPIAIPAGGATLSFDTAYGMETEWDFMWVQASTDAGTTWNTLTNTNTICQHDPGWIGGLYGFPNDLCGAGLGGLTDYNASFPDYDTETFNLNAFAGKNVLLRFWYMTDWGTTYEGPFVDNVKVAAGATTLFADDAEAGDAKWVYTAPWVRTDGTKPFTHNYYMQWRNTNANGGYDSSLGDPRWRYGPANTGLLMWYNDNAYTDNEVFNYLNDFPGFGPKGRMLVVDSHPDPYREPAMVAAGYNNEGGNVVDRSLMRDAPFTLQNTTGFTMTNTYPNTTTVFTTWFAGKPAVSTFNDALGYYPGAENVPGGPVGQTTNRWMTKQWDASVTVPAKEFYGIKAPGYKDGTRMRFDCSLNALGQVLCYSYASLGYNGGNGNPADANGQYGWHVQVVNEAPDHTWTTVRVWNSAVYKEIGNAPADISTPGVHTLTYTVSLLNASGPAAAGTVTMTLPGNLTYVSASPAGSTLNGNVLSWNNAALPSGQPITFTLVTTAAVKVGDAATSYVVGYNVVDSSASPSVAGSWTTKASLYALNTTTTGPATQLGTIGQAVTYTLRISNTGYNTTSYTVTAASTPSTWVTSLGVTSIGTGQFDTRSATGSVTVGPVAPGASAKVWVSVQVPSTAKNGDKATTTVTAASFDDPSKTTTTSFLTTTLFKVYLPLIRR